MNLEGRAGAVLVRRKTWLRPLYSFQRSLIDKKLSMVFYMGIEKPYCMERERLWNEERF